MNRKFLVVLSAVTLALTTIVVLFLILGSGISGYLRTAQAAPLIVSQYSTQPVTTTHTVCKAGPPSCDYSIIQAAVDAASDGDLIKIATGIYTDIHSRPVPADYILPPPSGFISQVVFISKTLTIRGGYNAAFSDSPDPLGNPTTIDANGLGRGIFGAGIISPTLDGLIIMNGNASHLGGYFVGDLGGFTRLDLGGGLFFSTYSATIKNSTFLTNVASEVDYSGSGGGLATRGGKVNVSDNIIQFNVGDREYGLGGGMAFFHSGSINLLRNSIEHNTAGEIRGVGGGIYTLGDGIVIVKDNYLLENIAGRDGIWGGGASIIGSIVSVSGNFVEGNIASITGFGQGGGILLRGYYSSNSAVLSNNVIISNSASLSETASSSGGGIYAQANQMTMTNNIVANNYANDGGSGIFYFGETGVLTHNTVADNRGLAEGIYLLGPSLGESHVDLANNIISGHRYRGVGVAETSNANIAGTLWYSNTENSGGEGTIITGTINLVGDPNFVAADVGDYHIGPLSAAIDAGIDAGLQTDIDGQARPFGSASDIGADEYYAPLTPTSVLISGPLVGFVGINHHFTATITPISATLLSCIWQATGQLPITHTCEITDHVMFAWDNPGTQTLTITVSNLLGSVTDIHNITITEPLEYIFFPLILDSQGSEHLRQAGEPPYERTATMPIMVPSFAFMLVGCAMGARWLKLRKS